MYFAMTNNRAVCGYDYRIVAMNSRADRNAFVKDNPEYNAITATVAKNHAAERIARKFTYTIFDRNKKNCGIAIANTDGEWNIY